jgi:hypothetical protein
MNRSGHKSFLAHVANLCLAFSVFFLACFYGLADAKADGGASLQFSPASGTFFLGSTFNVSFSLDTGGKPVNAIEVEISYPADKIQVVNPSVGTSFISIWLTPPSYSNTEGTLVFRGGVPNPGIITSNGVISTATFRARDVGDVELSYVETSKVLANDGNGTNILRSRGVARFKISLPPPEGPEVYSPTHPDPNVWYKTRDVTFFWKKDAVVDGFSYSFSRDPFEVPDEVSEGEDVSAKYTGVEDGIWYFHIKSRAGASWGGTTHYLVRIDGTPPAEFTVSAQPLGPYEPAFRPTLVFFTSDGESGMDHYELRIIQLNASENPNHSVTFFTEETSPYVFSTNGAGVYSVIVRAFDKAGNGRDSSVRLEFANTAPSRFSAAGIRFWGILVGWLWIGAALAGILLAALILVWLLRRKRRGHEEKMHAETVEREAELLREYQEIYGRVRAYRSQSAIEEPPMPPNPPRDATTTEQSEKNFGE